MTNSSRGNPRRQGRHNQQLAADDSSLLPPSPLSAAEIIDALYEALEAKIKELLNTADRSADDPSTSTFEDTIPVNGRHYSCRVRISRSQGVMAINITITNTITDEKLGPVSLNLMRLHIRTLLKRSGMQVLSTRTADYLSCRYRKRT